VIITHLAHRDWPAVEFIVEDCQRLGWACRIAASYFAGGTPASGVPTDDDQPELALYFSAMCAAFEALTMFGTSGGNRTVDTLDAIRSTSLTEPPLA